MFLDRYCVLNYCCIPKGFVSCIKRFKYFKNVSKSIIICYIEYNKRFYKGYKKDMVEIVFKDNKIQTGHRIKIPKAIVDTLELKEGEKVIIKFDVLKKKIIVEVEK